jgi:hypothetical protein
VRFFYFIDGVRDDLRPAVFNPEWPLEVRKTILKGLLEHRLPEGIREGIRLHHHLEAAVNQSWWPPWWRRP